MKVFMLSLILLGAIQIHFNVNASEFKIREITNAEITFQDVRPILEKRCVGCHSSNDFGDWSIYRIAFEKRNELYLRVVELKNMPLYSKMPQSERDIIKVWVERGAPEF